MVKIIKILEREVGQGMRLLGAATVNDLVPELVGHLCPTLIPHDQPKCSRLRELTGNQSCLH